MRHIVLDSAPLGLMAKPAHGTISNDVLKWALDCLAGGHHIYVPEVIDYEVRRELIRANKSASVRELDRLKQLFRFLPITSAAMLRAEQMWAHSRNSGQPTGDPAKLDIDVILAARALTMNAPAAEIIVATSNVAHLARFVSADLWSNIG